MHKFMLIIIQFKSLKHTIYSYKTRFECFIVAIIIDLRIYHHSCKPAISVVVKFQAHAIVNLIVLEGDMTLVDVVPLLDPNLVSAGSGLSGQRQRASSGRRVFIALFEFWDGKVGLEIKIFLNFRFNQSKL
jgi:hypothetical protein